SGRAFGAVVPPARPEGPGAGIRSSGPLIVSTPQDHLAVAPEMSRDDVLSDYRTAYLSRQMSIVARREVHGGRAKFGIFGDGKEVAQVAMARSFEAEIGRASGRGRGGMSVG